jgi:hypothetical protein
MMRVKSEQVISRVETQKTYQPPTLVKGPSLEKVTASSKDVSGVPTGGCWIARAAFGESDIRWMIFRAWLIEDAPAGMRRLYFRYGEAIGAWVSNRPLARSIVRVLMMPAVKKKSSTKVPASVR